MILHKQFLKQNKDGNINVKASGFLNLNYAIINLSLSDI